MNKLFTKIAKLSLGLAMAAGVGVAIGAGRKDASSVSATDVSDTLTAAKFTASGSSYLDFSGVSDSSDAVYAGNSAKNGSNIQMRSKNSNSGIVSTTSGGKVKSVTINVASGSNTVDVYGSNTAYTAASNLYGTSKGTKVGSVSSTGTINFTDDYEYVGIRSNNGAIYLSSVVITWTSGDSKTLSSISLGGSYNTNFTVGDTFNHTGMTVTANYSDSTSATVTGSATWSSPDMSTAGNKTVTVSYSDSYGSASTTYSITVSAPSTPFITPAKASTSGYTGQNESLSFTYGNLTGSLSVTSSNTSVVTVGTPSTSAGSGTVQLNFVGAGSTTVLFLDGSTQRASVSVNVTASSVSITGLAASSTAYVGKTLNLGSSVTVTATGIYTNAVTWESEDDDIATVSAAGVVTGVAEGTVDITVTSDDYPSATMTCTVTVESAPIADLLRTNSTSLNYTAGSYGDVSGVTKTGHSDITSEATYAGHFMCATGTNAGAIQFNPSKSSYICTTASSQLLSSIAVTFINANSKGVAFYGSNTAYTASYTAYGSVSGTELGVLTADGSFNVSGDYKYLYIVPTGTTYVGTIEVTWKTAKELSSVTTSGQTASFYAGTNFSYGGALTAHYSGGKADATVTPASFKFGASGINPTTAGTAITTSTTMEISTHNGKYIYVIYSEDDITKWASYQITVTAAPATSVTLSSSTGRVALEEVFNVSSITATVNPKAYATQGVTWEVYDSDGLVEDSTYMFDGAEFYATQPADVVFHVKANSNGSIYATFTLTVTGDPIAHLLDGELIDVTNGSTSVFADVGTLTYGVTTENFEGTITYTWSTTSSSTISIDDDQGDTCDFLVKAAGSARLSCRIQGSSKGDVTVYIDVTVTAVTVTSVTWTAPTIDVFSGASLSSTSGWNVKYSTNSGKTDQTPDSFNVKLGGSTISLPHTWVAADDGKTLCVEVGGVSSSTTTVAVTQSIHNVMAALPGESSTSTLTFTDKYATQGATSDGGEVWTVASDATSGESTYDATKGIHYGTGTSGTGNVTYITLTTSDFTSGKITRVVVNASTASGVTATVGVTVGGNQFGGAPKSLTSSAANYTFDGDADADEIIVTITKPSNAAKALYCKSIAVTYAEESGETENIANNASHKAAQRAAVAFAQAFNAAMDETENCTTGLDDAWEECSSAYDSFKLAAAALGETEGAWAKNLVKYATRAYSDDSGEACIERMMKTYEICVQKHEKTDFMSDLVTLGAPQVSPLVNIIGENTNTVAIIVIISMVSVTAIGGYFFLRKRKENI